MPEIVVTGFVPKELINIDAVRLELLNAIRAEGREIKKELNKTTSTWNHKVTFEMKVSLRRVEAEGYVKVWTTDEIYGYVNDGTRPHMMGPILPVNKKVLKIPTGGVRPKTRPGRLASYKGGARGPYAFAKSTKRYMHPGGEARDFTGIVARRIEKTRRFEKRLDDAIGRGLAKSNKGMKEIK